VLKPVKRFRKPIEINYLVSKIPHNLNKIITP